MKTTAKTLKRNLVIGIDAGGTKIRGVLMRGTTVLQKAEAFHGVRKVTKPIFLKTLYLILDTLYSPAIARVGIGLPGVIRNNRVIGANNVKILTQIDVKKLVEKKYHVKVVLDNDVKVALRQEAQRYKKYKSVFMLTLGTGIGGAWSYKGEIMKGGFGTAYELGKMVVDKRAGRFLELEDFCARKFFGKRGFVPLESENKARAGNKFHKQLWQEFGENLGAALANIINLIEPEVIVIGGGLAHAWPLFIPAAHKTIKKLVLSKVAAHKTKIVRAKNIKWVGSLGAARLAQQQNQ